MVAFLLCSRVLCAGASCGSPHHLHDAAFVCLFAWADGHSCWSSTALLGQRGCCTSTLIATKLKVRRRRRRRRRHVSFGWLCDCELITFVFASRPTKQCSVVLPKRAHGIVASSRSALLFCFGTCIYSFVMTVSLFWVAWRCWVTRT